MILLSWPHSDKDGDEPLSLYAELLPEKDSTYRTIAVDVRRGRTGHRLRFQLGFWEMTEPSPNPSFSGIRRMNVMIESLVSGLLEDLSSHGSHYPVPKEKMMPLLSKEAMRDLMMVLEVMES